MVVHLFQPLGILPGRSIVILTVVKALLTVNLEIFARILFFANSVIRHIREVKNSWLG